MTGDTEQSIMKQKAIFPGSFDPFTKGHERIVYKALPLFDEIIIAVGHNSTKSSYFPIDKRLKHIQELFQSESKVSIVTYNKLTVDLAAQLGAGFVLRGLRDGKDFDYEKSIALMNKDLNAAVETIFILTDKEYSAINASIVREIHKNNGNIDQFVSSAHIL